MEKLTIKKNTMKNKNFTVEIPNEHSPRFSTMKQAIKYAQELINNNPRFKNHELIY